jgi:hypothetical protein
VREAEADVDSEILVVFGLDVFLVELDIELVAVYLFGVIPIVIVEFMFGRLEQWTYKHGRSPFSASVDVFEMMASHMERPSPIYTLRARA